MAIGARKVPVIGIIKFKRINKKVGIHSFPDSFSAGFIKIKISFVAMALKTLLVIFGVIKHPVVNQGFLGY
jgi:hypothetical protein